MEKTSKTAALTLIVLLTLPAFLGIIPIEAVPDVVISTDKALYVMNWVSGQPRAVVAVSITNMELYHLYRIDIMRWASVANGLENLVLEQWIRNVSDIAAVNTTIIATVTPRSVPAETARHLAGTYNVTVYDITTGTPVQKAYINFGIWGLTSLKYNHCQPITAIGGGLKPGTTVAIQDNVTGSLTFYVWTTNATVGDYGLFTHVGRSLDSSIADAWYNATLVAFTPLTAGTAGITAEFQLTSLLSVQVWADKSTYQRTETITIYTQVSLADGTPVETASLWGLIFNGTAPWDSASRSLVAYINASPLNYPGVVQNWTKSAMPGIYTAKYKIQKNDEIGTWLLAVWANDTCGNWLGNFTGWFWPPVRGQWDVWPPGANATITVNIATLIKTEWQQPVSVEKTDTVWWTFNVTYPDGSKVALNTTLSKAWVIGPGDYKKAATLTQIEVGCYKASWWVPPDAPNGTYNFMVYAWNLTDATNSNDSWWILTTPFSGLNTTANKGPAADNPSELFAVGPAILLVKVATDKPVYTKVQTVLINATVRYSKDFSYMVPYMPADTYGFTCTLAPNGKVWIDIYWPNGSKATTINMMFIPPTPTQPPRWGASWALSTTYPSGMYTVWCFGDDMLGTVGNASTTFLVGGLWITPVDRGTVPPDWAPYLTYNSATGIVSAQIYTAAGKSLGTLITISGTGLTPNASIILTINPEDLCAPTLDWYANKLGVSTVATKGIQLATVTTDAAGAFIPVSVVFPSTPNKTYTILAIKSGTAGVWNEVSTGLQAWADFTVDPGMIVAPKNTDMDGNSRFVTGNTLCEVVATGYPQDAIYRPTLVEWATNYPSESWYGQPWVISGRINLGDGGTYFDLYLDLMLPNENTTVSTRVTENIVVLLINGTDALVPQVQTWANWMGNSYTMLFPTVSTIPIQWKFDGTATLSSGLSGSRTVIPGFVIPVLQPGLYNIELLVDKVVTTQNMTLMDLIDWSKGVYPIVGGNYTAFEQTVTTLSTGSDTVAVYGVTKDVIEILKALDTKIIEINGTVARIETELGKVELKLHEINATIVGINATVAQIKTMFGPIETHLSAIEAKVDTISGNVATIKTTLGTVATDVTDIKAKVTAINGTVATVSTTLGTVQTDVASIKTTVADVKSGVATLTTTVGTIDTNVKSIKDTVAGMSTATWVAAILAAVAAIAAIAAVIQITRKVYLK